MSKRQKIGLGLLVTLLIVSTAVYVISQPPSIEYIKEHPEDFSFNDYSNLNSLENALDVLLESDMNKSDIRKILVEMAGASEKNREVIGSNSIIYKKATLKNRILCPLSSSREIGWKVIIEYSSKDMFVSHRVLPPCF